MRYISSILLLSILLASCYKYIAIDNSLKYTVGGFHSITIDQNDSATMYVYVTLLSGDPTNEYITTRVTGLPANVTLNQDSLVFRPNYGFALTFHGNFPVAGVYPITVTTSSPTVGTHSYTFNLTVTSLVDYSSQITTYTRQGENPTMYSADTSASTYGRFYAEIDRTGCDSLYFFIHLDSIPPGGQGSLPEQFPVQAFNAVLNCTNNTIRIYPQTEPQSYGSNNQIKGSGTYTPTSDSTATITITDTTYSGSQIISVNTVHIY
jgi:hypothetical protein